MRICLILSSFSTCCGISQTDTQLLCSHFSEMEKSEGYSVFSLLHCTKNLFPGTVTKILARTNSNLSGIFWSLVIWYLISGWHLLINAHYLLVQLISGRFWILAMQFMDELIQILYKKNHVLLIEVGPPPNWKYFVSLVELLVILKVTKLCKKKVLQFHKFRL